MDRQHAFRCQLMTTVCATLALALCASSASAQDQQQRQGPKCSFSTSNISFGTVDVNSGQPSDAEGTFTYACTGDAREILRICPSWGGDRTMTSDAGDKVAFKLYSDPDRTTLWGTWFNRKMSGPTLDVPIGRSEKASGSVKAYGRVDAGQSIPPGAYKLSLKSNDTVITYGYVSEGSCDSFKNSKNWVPSPFMITATVQSGGGSAPPPPQGRVAGGAANPAPQAQDQAPPKKKGVWSRLKENAEFQQNKAQQAAGDDRDAAQRSKSEDKSEQQEAQDRQAKRADFIEANSCMTTAGAEKAEELSEECNKVTSAPHSACKIQEKTCDEIKAAIKKGCDGLAASAPDFCFTKYR